MYGEANHRASQNRHAYDSGTFRHPLDETLGCQRENRCEHDRIASPGRTVFVDRSGRALALSISGQTARFDSTRLTLATHLLGVRVQLLKALTNPFRIDPRANNASDFPA